MRTALAVFCLALTALTSACGSSDRKEYTLQGQIISVAPDHKSANIKHEEIVGFMAAMTMVYTVRDAKEFEPLVAGDLITATLVIATTSTSTETYLKDVKKVGTAPLEKAANDPSPTASAGFELLELGEPVPNGTFLDQDGKTVTLEDFRGQALILTFIYTSCPMPTFCPLMDKHFVAIQERLKKDGNLLKAHLLTVSFDPVVDTPAVLKQHGEKLGADTRVWTFLTGDRDEVDRWASRFGVSISRAMNDPKDITHNLRTAIIDRQGNLVQTYTGNDWTPEKVLADVRVMVGVD